MFIPDPGYCLDFFPSQTPDPVVTKAPDTESRIRNMIGGINWINADVIAIIFPPEDTILSNTLFMYVNF